MFDLVLKVPFNSSNICSALPMQLKSIATSQIELQKKITLKIGNPIAVCKNCTHMSRPLLHYVVKDQSAFLQVKTTAFSM